MDHNAVEDLGRREHKKGIEIQVPFAAAAAPSRSLEPDGYAAEGHADQRGVEGCARRYDPGGLPGKLLHLLLRKWRNGCVFQPAVFLLLLMDPDPCLVSADKFRYFPAAYPARRPYEYGSVGAELER